MNPLIHGEASWLLAQKLKSRRDRVLVVLAGISPDVDGVSLLFGEEAYGRWHHVLTHGLVSAVAFSVMFGLFANERRLVALLAFAAFHLHLVCDLAGSGPGWPIVYWWPFSRAELAWSGQWDLASWQNAVFGLSATLLCLACALKFGRTQFELFSVRLDSAVVKTLRARFGR